MTTPSRRKPATGTKRSGPTVTGVAAMKPKTPRIDRDKLMAQLRVIGDEYVFYMLMDAIDLLSPAKLAKVVGSYIRVEQLRPDEGAATAKRSLLEDVRVFAEASRRGDYYVSFNVNSKNHTEMSKGTRAFISECQRYFDRCVNAVTEGDLTETREAFELIFGLLRHIDEGCDDVVFFADEGGSWQVCVDWAKVFPAWFCCLARSAEPEAFASAVVETVDALTHFERRTHFAAARRLGTPAQREALDAHLARSGSK
ncbi:MAG: hypothetical protein ABI193_11725 [Minicystis sp.]